MQKKILSSVINVIPTKQSKIHLKTYMQIFEYFADLQEYESFLSCLKMFEKSLIEPVHLIEFMQQKI